MIIESQSYIWSVNQIFVYHSYYYFVFLNKIKLDFENHLEDWFLKMKTEGLTSDLQS